MRHRKSGFTLIELLVVISIIALLLSILMPSLQKVKELAKQVLCLSNTRQIGSAIMVYAMDNNDLYVAGRWNQYGDPRSMNAWYSNLTPWLDPSQTSNKDMYMLPDDEAARYNSIWKKLNCPAQRNYEPQHGVGQGITQLTYAFHIGGTLAGHRYSDGYGLFDWYTGQSRKLSSIRGPSGVLAITDNKDNEYVYSGQYSNMLRSNGRWDPEWFMPVRHPGGFVSAFADGHSDLVDEEHIRDEELEYTGSRLWKVE